MAETVRYTGDGSELFWRERVENLHAGAQLIVPDTHTAFIIRDGVASPPLASGKHEIIQSAGFFRSKTTEERTAVELAFISRVAHARFLWGTPAPVRATDSQTRVPVSLGLNGEIELSVKDPRTFFDAFVGANSKYDADILKTRVVSRIMTVVEPALACVTARTKASFAEFDGVRPALADEIGKRAAELLSRELGLNVDVFTVAGTLIPDEDIAAVRAKREELGIGKKQCPFCDAYIDEHAQFCKYCGARVE